MLSLFWAIQTITSIGYGNIMPLTFVECCVGSILQLVAGLMWAYIIGGIVQVAASMDPVKNVYEYRKEQANELIKEFTSNHGNNPDWDQTADSIRMYLSDQKKKCRNAGFTSNLTHRFPVIETFSPELKRKSSFLVVRNHLETIPYISSRFLSNVEQSYVAENCTFLEYPGGERMEITSRGIENLGRGVLLITAGTVSLVKLNCRTNRVKMKMLFRGDVIGEDEVIVENSNKLLADTVDYVSFPEYTRLVFIPQNAIMSALFRNAKAWKDCARWKYLKTLFLIKYSHQLIPPYQQGNLSQGYF